MNDMDAIETARELATHANDIEHLQADMDKLVKDMEEVKKSLAEIQRLLSEDRASKRTMHTVFNIIAVLFGGLVVALFEKFVK